MKPRLYLITKYGWCFLHLSLLLSLQVNTLLRYTHCFYLYRLFIKRSHQTPWIIYVSTVANEHTRWKTHIMSTPNLSDTYHHITSHHTAAEHTTRAEREIN